MSTTDDSDLPATTPMNDRPPGPGLTGDLVETVVAGDRLCIHHADERRMRDEWIESAVYVDTDDYA